MLAHELLVVAVAIGAAVEVVSSALSDSVDGTTGETALTHVVGSNIDLDLLDGLHTDGLCSGLAAIAAVGGKSEDVVVHGTVNLERVVTVVGSGERHRTGHAVGRDLRIHTRDVGNAVADRRHVVNHLCVDALRGSGLRGIQPAAACDDHLVEYLGIFLERAREVLRLTKKQVHIVETLGLMAHIGDFHLIGSAYTHTLDGVAAFAVGDGTIDGARGLVGSGNGGTNHLLAFRHDLAIDTRSGNLRRDLHHKGQHHGN